MMIQIKSIIFKLHFKRLSLGKKINIFGFSLI